MSSKDQTKATIDLGGKGRGYDSLEHGHTKLLGWSHVESDLFTIVLKNISV